MSITATVIPRVLVQPPVTDDTATRIINGESVSRARRTDPNSERKYWSYAVDGRPADPGDATGTTGRSPRSLGANLFDSRFADYENRLATIPMSFQDADPLGDDLAKLRAVYPALADFIAKGHTPPSKLAIVGMFDLGPVTVDRSFLVRSRITQDEAANLLRRHVTGDLGAHGDATGKPTDDELFLPITQPSNRQSAVAIATGHGVVQSRYQLWTAEDLKASEASRGPYAGNAPGYHRKPTDYVDIITLLSADKTRTIIAGLPCTDNY